MKVRWSTGRGGIMKVIEGAKAKNEDQYNNRHIKVRINRRFESHFEYHRIESIESNRINIATGI